MNIAKNIKFLIILAALTISTNVYGELQINHDIYKHLLKPGEESQGHTYQNIDCVYMINLKRSQQRWKKSCEELNPHNIFPYRFIGFDGWKDLNLEILNDIGVKYDKQMDPIIQKGLEQMGRYWSKHLGIRGFASTHFHSPDQLNPGTIGTYGPISVEGKTYFCHCLHLGQIGCLLSHVSVLQNAYDNNYELVWIMEDDVRVIESPEKIINCISMLDQEVGRDHWDILFTDTDTINPATGEKVYCRSFAPRPNFHPKNPQRFSHPGKKYKHYNKVFARYGAYSFIITRSGIEKLLEFFYTYKFFVSFDVDYFVPDQIKLYSVNRDIISHQLGNITSMFLKETLPDAN